MNKKYIISFVLCSLVTLFITLPITSMIFAEQSGSTPESGSTSRIKQVYDALVILTYGDENTGGWGDWEAFWNRIRSAAEWTPTGTVTTDKVAIGETFYSDSRTQQTGILALTGDATVSDVMTGKSFYGNSFTQQTGTWDFLGDADPESVFAGETFYNSSNVLRTGTWDFLGDADPASVFAGETFYNDSNVLRTGTWSFLGDANPANVFMGETFYNSSNVLQTGTWDFLGDADPASVFAGETFYNDSNVLRTGTWSFLGDATASDVLSGKTFYGNSSSLLTGIAAPPIDFTNQEYSTRDDYGGPNGSGAEDYQGEESVWTSPASDVWKDTRTGVYWSSNQGTKTNNFTAMSLNTCDFFNTSPRKDYAGGDADCGVAINYCATLDFGGRTDWYLPSQKQLLQAYIDGMYNQAGTTLANAATFTTTSYFWSSSEVSTSSTGAWFVGLHGGYTFDDSKIGGYAVRCVARD